MGRLMTRWIAVAAAVAVVVLASIPVFGANPKTKRVSVRSNGAEAEDGDSLQPSISGGGRLVAFYSDATNLVPDDDNDETDVFVHNRKTGKTKRVSVRSNGAEAEDGSSYNPSMSADGRFVAFESSATNLVRNDDNDDTDVFVHNRETGKTKRVSVRSNGAEAKGGDSYSPSISRSGRFVAFESSATNLVRNDDNGYYDIFVHDRKTGKTRRVSLRSNGAEAEDGSSFSASISGRGRSVAFRSVATNLVLDDDNGYDDIFVHNRKTGKTKRVNVRSNGAEAEGGDSYSPSMSGGGRFVAFYSFATNLIPDDDNTYDDVFVHNRKTGKTKRVSVRSNGNEADDGGSFAPSISGSGRFVAFHSNATNLVLNDENDHADVFVHDRRTGRTRRVSVRSNGAETDDQNSYNPSISADGRFVAFESFATNLVHNDENETWDIFVRGPLR